MIGTILGCAAIFGISEIFGEVYHSWNYDHEKNVLINAGKKLADCTEVIEDKTAEVRGKATAKKNYVNACKPKQIISSADSLEEALKALDLQIESINKSKSADILTEESNLVKSVAEVCDLIAKECNLGEEDNKALAELKEQGMALAAQLKNNEITNQATAKKKIKNYVGLVQPFIDKKFLMEATPIEATQLNQVNDGTEPAKFSTEETKIPDFTQNVTPLTVAEVKTTAKKKGAKNNKENQEG